MKRFMLFVLTLAMLLNSAMAFAAEGNETMKEKVQQYKLENDPVYIAAQKERMANLPKVAVMYVNNAKTTYDGDVDQSVKANLAKSISPDKYVTIEGAPYVEKLKKAGIVDIATAEKADIVDAFAGEDVDYVVFLEVQPFIARDKMTFFTIGKDITATVPFKLIDVVNGKYLYNGKFTEKMSDSSWIGGIGNKSVALKVMAKINEQITATLAERLPAEKPTLAPKK